VVAWMSACLHKKGAAGLQTAGGEEAHPNSYSSVITVRNSYSSVVTCVQQKIRRRGRHVRRLVLHWCNCAQAAGGEDSMVHVHNKGVWWVLQLHGWQPTSSTRLQAAVTKCMIVGAAE
jgi:hypothetical protein